MPADERMFRINEAVCCVEVRGGVDDPTMLLVGSSMLSWPDELCERITAGGRRVIRYGVRDTGRSESYPPGEPGYSLADLVDDAVGVLDATATERAHVVGMSTGGWIAQLLALDHPERVATLTLVASRPNTPGPVDDDLPEHDEALMEVIMNSADPDWSDERAVVDHLVLQARTFAGAGAFDEASARAHAEAEVARTTDVRCATTNIAFADHGPRWRERLGEITRRRWCCTAKTTRSSRSATARHSPLRSPTPASSGSIASGIGSRPMPSLPSRKSYSRTRPADLATRRTTTAPRIGGHSYGYIIEGLTVPRERRRRWC